MHNTVIIIGGGVAGMQCAIELHRRGIRPIIIEREQRLGGKVQNYHLLFPSLTPAKEFIAEITEEVNALGIECRTSAEAISISRHSVKLGSGENLSCSAVVIATGFTTFDARIKEEYGYGIYPNVYTTLDIERMFAQGALPSGSAAPKRIALLHCVGSRDEKVGQSHCSKVCCITGVKQAVELKKHYPHSEIFNFYMDIRMFGAGYEEIYHNAQIRHHIHFIRGRISEAAPTHDARIQIKAEDTLTARPLRMSVDMLILIVGMSANPSNATLSECDCLRLQPSRFFAPVDFLRHNTSSGEEGIFYAGAATAPKCIGESINDAMHAAASVAEYFKKNRSHVHKVRFYN